MLLSKLFLQNMQKIMAGDGFEELWMRILHFFEEYMKVDRSSLLAEAVPESLKSILFFIFDIFFDITFCFYIFFINFFICL